MFTITPATALIVCFVFAHRMTWRLSLRSNFLRRRSGASFTRGMHRSGGYVCTEAVVPRDVDPLLVVERLLSALHSEVDVILVHQPEALSVLLRRYAQDTIVLVQTPHAKSRALWASLVPREWAPLLLAHWKVADLVYTYTRRLHQAAVLDRTAGAFFGQFSCRPSP
jgi:hypothetical protein